MNNNNINRDSLYYFRDKEMPLKQNCFFPSQSSLSLSFTFPPSLSSKGLHLFLSLPLSSSVLQP